MPKVMAKQNSNTEHRMSKQASGSETMKGLRQMDVKKRRGHVSAHAPAMKENTLNSMMYKIPSNLSSEVPVPLLTALLNAHFTW